VNAGVAGEVVKSGVFHPNNAQPVVQNDPSVFVEHGNLPGDVIGKVVRKRDFRPFSPKSLMLYNGVLDVNLSNP
jgi:hypothetical protein